MSAQPLTPTIEEVQRSIDGFVRALRGDPTDDDPGDRRLYIGGSTIAAVLGKDKSKSPLRAWREIVGLDPRDSSDDPEAAFWGRRFQAEIAARCAMKGGYEIWKPDEPRLWHPKHSFIGVRPDYYAHPDAVLEIKSVELVRAHEFGDAGTDEVPDPVFYQAQLQAGLARRARCKVGVLIGKVETREFRFPFEPDFYLWMIEEAARWYYLHIVMGQPPDPRSNEEAVLRWPVADERIVHRISVPGWKKLQRLNNVKAEQKRLKTERDTLELALKEEVGDGQALADGTSDLVRWGNQKRFDHEGFAQAHPDIYQRFLTVLDREGLEKAHRKLYNEHKLPPQRGRIHITKRGETIQ